MVLYNILSTIVIFAIILNIELFDKKMNILSELYRVFWLYNINGRCIRDADKWKEKSVEINIRYLLNRYIENSLKIEENITYFQFVSSVGTEIDKFYKKHSRKYMLIVLGICSIFLIIATIIKENYFALVINAVVVILFVATLFFLDWKILKRTLARLCIDEKGYSICIKKKKNEIIEIFIPEVGFRTNRNKYKKYINSLN